MFDIKAPIEPGQSAAGIRIGTSAREILSHGEPQQTDRFRETDKLVFPFVTLWVRDGRVQQVAVRAPYEGRIGDQIGIGSTVKDIESTLGKVVQDKEDNLTVTGSPGWCFEADQWSPGGGGGRNRQARISEIFIFSTGG